MGRMRQIGQMLCLAMLGLATAAAWSVTIGWDGSRGATGYRVHHGRASGTYTNVIEAGTNQASFGLPPGTNYIAVSAYNVVGESGLSEELVFVQPPPPLTLLIETSGELLGPWLQMFSAAVTNNEAQRFFRMTLK